MKRIAKFHKVSLEQFMEGWKDTFGEQYTEDQIKALYEEIKLPKRATAGSAGYDFYAPDDFVIEPGKTIKIPTGIRVKKTGCSNAIREADLDSSSVCS